MVDEKQRLLMVVVNKIQAEIDYNIAAALFDYRACLNNVNNEIRMNVIMPVAVPAELVPDLESAMCAAGWDKCSISAYFLPMYMPSADKYDSQLNEVETKLQVLDVRLYTELMIQGVNDNR